MSNTIVTVYSSSHCPFCDRALALLNDKRAEGNSRFALEVLSVDGDPDRRKVMANRAGGKTSVPQIWIGDTHVGGCDDLIELNASGELDKRLCGDQLGK